MIWAQRRKLRKISIRQTSRFCFAAKFPQIMTAWVTQCVAFFLGLYAPPTTLPLAPLSILYPIILLISSTINNCNMSSTLRTLRSPALRTPLRTLSISHYRCYATGTSDWAGRQKEEHVANRGDELDVQSGASQSGERERASNDENQSQAATEKDKGNQNEQAKKDHPEAPGPVIGMNDERGQVSSFAAEGKIHMKYTDCDSDGA